MKKIFIIVAVYFIASCSERNKAEEASHLKGAVKSIVESTHDAYEAFGEIKHDAPIKPFSFVIKSIYNLNGDLIEHNTYDPSGFYTRDSIFNKVKYEYDKQGNEVESRSYNGSGKLITIWKSFYDESGNLTTSSNCEYVSTDPSSIGTEENNFYNEKGQVIKSIIQECTGKQIMTYEFKYDENDNKIWEKLTMSESNPIITTFKYGENNELIGETSDNGKFKYRYEFDLTGNWIKKYVYKNETIQKVVIREIEYDEKK